VLSDNGFVLVHEGYVAGLSVIAGSLYYLSDGTAGLLTTSEPTTEGHYSKPVLIASSTTEGFFFNYRGIVIATPIPGPTGPTGPTGPMGPTGATGPTGPSVGLFDIDVDGGLEPITGTLSDDYFELDGNDDIQPKTV
jgi:hypothetical protein